MEGKLSELKPDRNLLDFNFDGYKLSLEPLTITKHELCCPISRVLIDPNFYSFLHAKIFGLHNFLIGETTDSHESVYFVNKEKQVKKASLNPYNMELVEYQVWAIPTDDKTQSEQENYNISFKLLEENLAVLSDGSGTLYLLETGDRSWDVQWKSVYTGEPLDSKTFYIQDAVLEEKTLLHVILCRIVQGEKKAQLNIHWVTFSNNDNTWERAYSRELLVKGDLSYLYLERTCKAIYVASSLGCRFISDSLNPITPTENKNNSVVEEKQYKWSQDSESVVIYFILARDSIKKEELIVNCENTSIKVEYEKTILLNGELYERIDKTLTTINISKNLIEINLVKVNEGSNWTSLLIGGADLQTDETYSGSDVHNLNHLTSDEIEKPSQGMTFNTEQVEECDFSNSDFTIFERLCVKTHETTHKYNFGSNPVLLTVDTDKGKPPSLGLRHDVDVCLWEPLFENDNFILKHSATLLAFGYIQASKQQKKFLACPPDASYSAICETSRHIFLYRQKIFSSCVLKNCKTGARVKTRAEQKVLSIPSEEIYGFYATSDGLYILGEKYLMYIDN